MDKKTFKRRRATIDDSPDISELSNQLGYPTSEADSIENLGTILKSDDHIVYVVVLPDGKVIGWIHVYKAQRIESGMFAEIGGFIVSEAFRGKGIGILLLKAAEDWTVKMKLPKLRVRSKVNRQDAAKFYSHMGFSISKEQRVFDKIVIQNA